MMTGLISSPSQSEPTINAPQNVVFVGHNFRKDFDKTASGLMFNLKHNNAHVMGVLDTEWLATDAEYTHPSLATIVENYNLAEMEWSYQ
jgi:hypothetical protein